MEIWKEVKGFEGIYEVSNLGRVKALSIRRLNGRYYFISKEKILKQGINARGYCILILNKNGIRKTKSVHQIVAEAFLNHKPCGHKLVINHKNFVRTDNKLENLEIITQRENASQSHLKNTSKYVGVSFYKPNNKWVAQIVVNKKQIRLGYFENEIDASNRYKEELNKILKNG